MRYSYESLQNQGQAIYSLPYDITAPLRVAVVGLLKAGKSTFLSAITQQPEFFKSGVIRTTFQNQEHTDRFFSWVDTPGIDDTTTETITALAGIDSSDIVLFVHNLKQGELDKSELEFIEKCVMKDNKIFEKLVFVLTHLSDVGDQAAAEVIQKIKNQCKNNLSTSSDFDFFTVNSLSYIKGLKEGKKVLLQRSNIPILQQELLRIYQLRLVVNIGLQIDLIQKQLNNDCVVVESNLRLASQ